MARTLVNALPKVLPSFPVSKADAVAAHPQPQAAPTAQPMPTVAMLVTLAAADPTIERRRREAKKAGEGLEMLETVHRELLAGTLDECALQDLAEWARAIDTPEDPVLAEIMRDIDLRVRVELAKYDVEV
ncbi:flagellar assembly protein FliX [Stakelama tenebrarum]|uniref:Flagellar trans-acting factor FliX n=1 Tax=Stakelama tenebrarum TaxID=2711215 RepID=A0A6G6Y4D0_9SPHN|nr:flagellar assembly protein FliX [Sphingosinithalassobacter tenebrarum]QIG79701.1 flagellar trans-acting factor FliX [Sphingosinithalassobacter tenebrarum]